MSSALTKERVAELLDYSPDSGEFVWRPVRARAHRKGVINTTNVYGYIVIQIDKRIYKAHRLAWLYCTGSMPIGVIDHINGVKTDNRICNLRDTSSVLNSHNRRNPNINSTTGFLGVYQSRGAFVAAIKINGRNKHIGSFKTAIEAHEAYMIAKQYLHIGYIKLKD